jgi:hypothetical protein
MLVTIQSRIFSLPVSCLGTEKLKYLKLYCNLTRSFVWVRNVSRIMGAKQIEGVQE